MNISIILLLVLSYLLGSLPIGLLVGRMVKGIDVRDYGSGNIGASNVWRAMGPFWGVFVFLLDVAKGLMPVQMASHHFPPLVQVLAGLAAILGHNFSPFLKFKGGKGVATSLGVAFGLQPLAAVLGFAVWGLCLLVTRTISVSSMIGTVVTCLLIWAFSYPLAGTRHPRTQSLLYSTTDPHGHWPYALFGLLATMFVVYKHRANIARVKAGTEPKVGAKT